ncbi:MAG: DUF2066 domain-containing protein [Alphaproteobacteria bacterium]
MAVTRRLVALIVVVAWAVLAPALGSQAAEHAAVFSISGVAVDVTAKDAARARSRARIEGQRRALERLLRRIVPAADYARIPDLDDHDVTDLVQGFEVSNERVAPERYRALLTFHFKPNAVGAVLRNANTPYAVMSSRPVLVLSLYRVGNELLLWDDDNPWRAVWANLPPSDGLVPVIVPIGELADITLIDARQAREGERDLLAELAERYDAGEVVVVEAEFERDTLLGAPTVSVAMRRYREEGMRIGGGTYSGTPRATIESVLVAAAEATRMQLEEEWKEINLLHFDRADSLAIDIPLAGLEDWLDIRGRLSDLALVRRVEIAALSARFARVMLHYFGDPQQLAAALANMDLDLGREADLWILRRYDAGAGRSMAREATTTTDGSAPE